MLIIRSIMVMSFKSLIIGEGMSGMNSVFFIPRGFLDKFLWREFICVWSVIIKVIGARK
jgi:hypothetical protein